MCQHLEQFGAVRPRFRNPVIQGIVVRDRRKARVKTGFHARPFCRGRRLLIDTQFMVVVSPAKLFCACVAELCCVSPKPLTVGVYSDYTPSLHRTSLLCSKSD